MSHIKNIEIKNFKSIRHAKIEDCRRVNVFIGYPNVGKSNILEALSLLGYVKKDVFLPLSSICRFKELTDIFMDGDKRKNIEIWGGGYIFSAKLVDKLQVTGAIIDAGRYLSDIDFTLLEPLKEFNFNKQGSYTNTHVKEYNEKIGYVKKYEYNPLKILAPSNNPTILNFPYGSNLSEVIRYNEDLRKECGELFAAYNLKIVFDENQNMLVQKQLDEFSAFQFSMSQVADTLQRLIFHKAAILTNENTVLLFEEPEAHMFPPYIAKFTNDIVHDENKNQFFITTHSPFVLNDLIENLQGDELAIYIVRYKKETGETLIDRLSEKELHEAAQFGYDFFMNLENFIPAN
jgi:AAA15 family ATPase/GTPase